ncbi:LuxR C-terminal-related transcriptional regulator [Kitasatospora sp. NPDC056138]|uniref:helix-turn-helix transcriptional regulator n=1 Tax=Kitasatospora sp. NPDC056138 TaxID=3345724 RepID=UPI0035E2A6CD
MVNRLGVERKILGEIADLSAAGLPVAELFRELTGLLRSGLGFDGGCFHGADPVTGFLTSTVSEGLDARGFEQAAYLEFWSADSTRFVAIRESGLLAQSVVRANHGRPERSVRYRDLLAELGYVDELRVNFDVQGGRWGSAAFMRERGQGPFRARDVQLMARAARLVGAALRDSHRPAQAGDGVGCGDGAEWTAPAVVILSAGGGLVSADRQGQALLAELTGDDRFAGDVPSGLAAVAELARASAVGRRQAGAQARILTPGGRWVILHASALEGRADGQIAIVATPASPAQNLPVALMAHGLTAREQEVALGAVRGDSTRTLARRLSLSEATVQDHLKKIFDKTGVRSRRALVALLMASHLDTVDLPPG